MQVKVLGTGCSACRNMLNDVRRIVAKNGWQADIEYVQDLDRILSYNVMSTPVLVIDEKVFMTGYRGPVKIAEALQNAIESPA